MPVKQSSKPPKLEFPDYLILTLMGIILVMGYFLALKY